MQYADLYVTDLSTTHHHFGKKHFCRGNTNRRKTRIGLIIQGSGSYLYLNKRLNVSEGDVVFVPENIYCYSEWTGAPEIDVIYINCFLHYEWFCYEPQTIPCSSADKSCILQIASLLTEGDLERLEAYSLVYKLLKDILPVMTQSQLSLDKTLSKAVEYLQDHWDEPISVQDIARQCLISESTVYHMFQKQLGQTPIRYLNEIRINQAIQLLENTDYSISAIIRQVGFPSENHFRKVFADMTGMTPLRYRKNSRQSTRAYSAITS